MSKLVHTNNGEENDSKRKDERNHTIDGSI
jgi:hypothetical protein